MRILLTNDDGIHAAGIVALHHALSGCCDEPHTPNEMLAIANAPAADIWTVAPLTVQSATSHGVTFHEPLMVKDITIDAHMAGLAVDARPADCVKLALTCLWPERYGQGERPSLLLSGLNAGANCGINHIYSGTVAAALEGAFLGVPSIALSLMIGRAEPDFNAAALHARRALEAILKDGLPDAHTCLSVNIPPCAVDDEARYEPRAIKVCPMNTHGLRDSFEKRTSPSGETYYWSSGSGLDFHHTTPGSDVHELFAGSITITPLTYDLTSSNGVAYWQERLNQR